MLDLPTPAPVRDDRSGQAHWSATPHPPAAFLPRWLVGEFFGTFLLVFFGCGSVCAAVLTGAQVGIFQVAIVWGLGITTAIYLTGSLSGAHLNPAVTLAMAVWGGFPARRVVPYVAVQLAGAFVSAAILYVVFSGALHVFEKKNGIVRGETGSELSAKVFGEFFPPPSAREPANAPPSARLPESSIDALVTPVSAFFIEVVGTAVLLLVIFCCTDESNANRPQILTAATIGLTVTLLISLLGPLTMACFNPARDLGPRLFSALAGWGSVPFTANGSGWWTVYIVAPIVGAQVGGAIYRFCFKPCYASGQPRHPMTFANTLQAQRVPLRRTQTRVLQINVGKLCNLTCAHCHVNAGPKRKEIMTRGTVDRILGWLERTDIPVVDLTGGAPEMIPDFRYLIERLTTMTPGRHVMDRCNLTILLEPSQDGLAEFLAEHRVEIVASMPCYSPKNVDEQRGNGVFDASIAALQLLNRVGYGRNAALPLNLVYNPVGAFLPGPQEELEADYKRELLTHFGIVFDKLYTITNVPVSRFASYLRHNGQYKEYLDLLADSFNPHAVAGLMCRDTINVSWTGEVFDCDFNQMLKMQWRDGERALSLWDIDPAKVEDREILTAEHCFACTAGAGSSCGGALV